MDSDVVIPIMPGNARLSKIFSDVNMPPDRQIELDVIDDSMPVIIRVSRHRMVIEVSTKGVLIKPEKVQE